MSRLAREFPGEAPLPLAAGATACFTDLHLKPERADEIDDFRAALADLPADTVNCVVMGDLFDAYVGAEDWLPEHFAALRATLGELVARGIRTVLLRGNRDALLIADDLGDSGVEVGDSVLLPGAAGGAAADHPWRRVVPRRPPLPVAAPAPARALVPALLPRPAARPAARDRPAAAFDQPGTRSRANPWTRSP